MLGEVMGREEGPGGEGQMEGRKELEKGQGNFLIWLFKEEPPLPRQTAIEEMQRPALSTFPLFYFKFSWVISEVQVEAFRISLDLSKAAVGS